MENIKEGGIDEELKEGGVGMEARIAIVVGEDIATRNLYLELFHVMWTQQWEEFLSVLEQVPDVNHVFTLKFTPNCRCGVMFETFSCSMGTWFSLAEKQVCHCFIPDDSPAEETVEFAGITPMHCAATLEDTRYLQEIMARGGFVNARTLIQELGPLNLAAHKSRIDPLRTLLSTRSIIAFESHKLELQPQEAGTSENCPKCGEKACECDSEVASKSLSHHHAKTAKVWFKRKARASKCSSNALPNKKLESQPGAGTSKNDQKCGENTCENDSEVVSKRLSVANVCDVDITGKNGRTAFLTALMHEFREGAEELMKYGADVNKFDIYDTVPVIEATRRGYPLEFIEKMVEGGCDVDACPNGSYDVALHYAVYMEEVNVVELLLRSGSNPDKIGQSHTPLVIASFVGDVRNVQALVKYGANVNMAPTPANYTALHFAAWEGHLSICEELVKAGATPDARTRDLNTPLSLGAHGKHYNVVDFFLSLGACNVNNQDKDEDTALHYSAYNGDVESTKALLKSGAAANSRNSVDATPLWNACYMSKLEIVKLLVKHNVVMELCSRGIDQHSQTDDIVLIYDSPKSPLYAAAEQGAYDIVKYLVEEGYNINDEQWIHWGEFPYQVLQDEGIRSWLIQEYYSPRSLIQLCRRVINRGLGDKVEEKSQQLQIPNTLRDYLLHMF